MESLEELYALFQKLLAQLEDTIMEFEKGKKNCRLYETMRDSLIKRFDHSMDSFWRVIKLYLEKFHGFKTTMSSKVIIKRSLDVQLVTLEEQKNLLKMLHDRNITCFTYNSVLAENISKDIPQYYNIMKKVGMRIDHMLYTQGISQGIVRETRK